jgi:hypothetical protein
MQYYCGSADTNVTMLTIPKGIAIVMQEHCRRQCDGVDLCTANNNAIMSHINTSHD